jgi:hypothetical protein
MSMTNVPRIAIHRFWTEYRPERDDPNKFREVDMVAYGPIGSLDRTVNIERISRLSCVDSDPESDNDAVVYASMRWEAIRPYYESWKDGREGPVDGTPLEAWNGVAPEQAEFLRARGIKSVEQLAELTEGHFSRFGLPGIRNMVSAAKRYLDSSDARKFAASMAEKDQQITHQQVQISDQQAQITALLQRLDSLAESVAKQQGATADGPAKRGPGRPRKDEARQTEEVAAA